MDATQDPTEDDALYTIDLRPIGAQSPNRPDDDMQSLRARVNPEAIAASLSAEALTARPTPRETLGRLVARALTDHPPRAAGSLREEAFVQMGGAFAFAMAGAALFHGLWWMLVGV